MASEGGSRASPSVRESPSSSASPGGCPVRCRRRRWPAAPCAQPRRLAHALNVDPNHRLVLPSRSSLGLSVVALIAVGHPAHHQLPQTIDARFSVTIPLTACPTIIVSAVADHARRGCVLCTPACFLLGFTIPWGFSVVDPFPVFAPAAGTYPCDKVFTDNGPVGGVLPAFQE